MEFYKKASFVLKLVLQKKGTIKSLCLQSKEPNKKKIYALLCQTLQKLQLLEKVIEESKILSQERLQRELALLLLHDFLFNKRGIQCGGPFKAAIMRHRIRLKAELTKAKLKFPDLIKETVEFPRYVRVNTLRISVDDSVRYFVEKGWELVSDQPLKRKQKLFFQDLHLPCLLVFPPGSDFHDDELYQNGSIILQDKASCFPAYVLNAPDNSFVIDACAAPGNKTSHISSIMNNSGKIVAFDLDNERLETLKRLVGKAGCKKATHQDYGSVEFILLDPSCSGSGIKSRMDEFLPEEDMTADRIEKLSEFQLKMLMHALSFPSVKRVVYSTCSIHEKENEFVVRSALASMPQWELLPESEVLPAWKRRGIQMPEAMRVDPAEDNMNGFFVACFKRKE